MRATSRPPGAELGAAFDGKMAKRLPVAIAIRCDGRRHFHAACPGSSADYEGWPARKSGVVGR